MFWSTCWDALCNECCVKLPPVHLLSCWICWICWVFYMLLLLSWICCICWVVEYAASVELLNMLRLLSSWICCLAPYRPLPTQVNVCDECLSCVEALCAVSVAWICWVIMLRLLSWICCIGRVVDYTASVELLNMLRLLSCWICCLAPYRPLPTQVNVCDECLELCWGALCSECCVDLLSY